MTTNKYPAAPRVFGTRDPALTRYLQQDSQLRSDRAFLRQCTTLVLSENDRERLELAYEKHSEDTRETMRNEFGR